MKLTGDKDIEININETIDRIKDRYNKLLNNEIKTIYCSYGIFGNIDIELSGNDITLFDIPHMYIIDKRDFDKYFK